MLDREELQNLRVFTEKSETDKAFRTLEGILRGIDLDRKINLREIHELKHWCGAHVSYVNRHPFNEAIPMIMGFVEDNELDPEEYEDLLWFTEAITGNSIYYDAITGDLQVLHGIMHGILSDNIINEQEIRELENWINNNVHLKGCFPYDELYSLVKSVLEDGKLDDIEVKILKAFFADFISKDDTTINIQELERLKDEMSVPGICSINPDIQFPQHLFCFTGTFGKCKKSEIERIVIDHGALYSTSVTKNLDYLVVGNGGNPCWAFSCYGRKVELARTMRKEGARVQLVNENDFWKAV
jgi:hypothetical protein